MTGEHLSEGRVITSSGVATPSPSLMPSQSNNESLYQSTSALSQSNHHHQSSMSCCLVLLSSVRAHQQPINVMRCHGDRVVTASNDHTLKVFCYGVRQRWPQTMTMMATHHDALNHDDQRHNWVKFVQRCHEFGGFLKVRR